MNQINSKIKINEPDFTKYITIQSNKEHRKSMTALGGNRENIETKPFKFKVDNRMIDYQTFADYLGDKFNKTQGKIVKPNLEKTKFLETVQSLGELNDYLNPGNYDLDKNDEKHRLQMLMHKANEDHRKQEAKNETDYLNFQKFMTEFLHLNIAGEGADYIEDAKKHKQEDIDLNHLTEHFISKKSILDKALINYSEYKADQSIQNAKFPENM